MGFIDGVNTFQFVHGEPTTLSDGSGLAALPTHEAHDEIAVDAANFGPTFLAHAGWSLSTVVKGPPMGEMDASKWWTKLSQSGDKGTYAVDGIIETVRHSLSPKLQDGVDYEKMVYDIGRFNDLIGEHEDHVISIMQRIWSPSFTTCGADWQLQLDAEYARRKLAVDQAVDTIEAVDVLAAYQLLRDVIRDAHDSTTRVDSRIEYWQGVYDSELSEFFGATGGVSQ